MNKRRASAGFPTEAVMPNKVETFSVQPVKNKIWVSQIEISTDILLKLCGRISASKQLGKNSAILFEESGEIFSGSRIFYGPSGQGWIA